MKFTANSGGPALEGPSRICSWRFALGLLLLLLLWAGELTGTWAQPLRQSTAHRDSHTTAHVACCSYVQGSKIIDPNWYVDRGVRPIGRYGKRLLARSRGPGHPSGPSSPILAARAPILRAVTSSGLRGRASRCQDRPLWKRLVKDAATGKLEVVALQQQRRAVERRSQQRAERQGDKRSKWAQ